MMHRRRWLQGAALTAAAGLSPVGWSQSGRPARLLVGFPPGGSTDVVARLVGGHYRVGGGTAIVENVPGAAGRLAVTRVKASAPDGGVVLVSPAAMMTLYPHVYKQLAYDPLKDFIPVAAVGTISFALVASAAAVPASVKTLPDLVAWYQANPKLASFASGGAGTPMHFVGVMVAKHAGLDLTHVAYRGAAPMVQDLLGGQVAVGVTVLGDSLPHVPSGKLRVIAISGPKRSSYLPEAATFIEQGAPNIVTEENFGIYLPAGAAPEAVERWHGVVREALAAGDVKDGLAKLACEPSTMSQPAFAASIAAELQRWGPVVKASGFSLDD